MNATEQRLYKVMAYVENELAHIAESERLQAMDGGANLATSERKRTLESVLRICRGRAP